MKFKKHQCIEVHHQYGVKRYECEKFADAAQFDGWDYSEYANEAEAREAFGDEIPDELRELLRDGAAVEVSAPEIDLYKYLPATKFDAESEALDYLGSDLHRLIVIDDTDEARDIAENYRGHEDIAVRRAAREILEEAEAGYIEVAE